MRAVVIHHNLNTPGGEATVAIETMQCLSELGFDVELLTVQRPDLKRLTRAYGKEIRVDRIREILPFKMDFFGMYQRLLTILSSLNLGARDIIVNTNGSAMPYGTRRNNVRCILYLHFATSLLGSSCYCSLIGNKYQKSFFWKAYFRPYQAITNVFTKSAIATSQMTLTNSRFSREAIMKAYPGVDPCVLYPPIDIERFSPAYHSRCRTSQVLIIARFSPEKQLEKAIKIAKILKDLEFTIIGSLTPANRPYFTSLQKMISNYGLQKMVRLIPNATNQELIDEMSASTVYLHTMAGEHFGISIVEAMAAGLVPVVPTYGGCSEIVPSEFQYGTLEEAARHISKNIEGYDKEKRRLLYQTATQFSPFRFRKMMQQYIEQVCKIHKVKESSLDALIMRQE
jgi:glycosyltransferase involved in cell wall biosynthesis